MTKILHSRFVKCQSYDYEFEANYKEIACYKNMLNKRGWWLENHQFSLDDDFYIAYLHFIKLDKEEVIEILEEAKKHSIKLDAFNMAMVAKYGKFVSADYYNDAEDWEFFNLCKRLECVKSKAEFYAEYYGL